VQHYPITLLFVGYVSTFPVIIGVTIVSNTQLYGIHNRAHMMFVLVVSSQQLVQLSFKLCKYAHLFISAFSIHDHINQWVQCGWSIDIINKWCRYLSMWFNIINIIMSYIRRCITTRGISFHSRHLFISTWRLYK
jgi:hypothetical protein